MSRGEIDGGETIGLRWAASGNSSVRVDGRREGRSGFGSSGRHHVGGVVSGPQAGGPSQPGSWRTRRDVDGGRRTWWRLTPDSGGASDAAAFGVLSPGG